MEMKDILEEMQKNYLESTESLEKIIIEEEKLSNELSNEFKQNKMFKQNIEELKELKEEIKNLRVELNNIKIDNITLGGLIAKEIKDKYESIGKVFNRLHEKTIGSLQHLYNNIKNQIKLGVTKRQQIFIQNKVDVVKKLVGGMETVLRQQQEQLESCLKKIDSLSNEIEKDGLEKEVIAQELGDKTTEENKSKIEQLKSEVNILNEELKGLKEKSKGLREENVGREKEEKGLDKGKIESKYLEKENVNKENKERKKSIVKKIKKLKQNQENQKNNKEKFRDKDKGIDR